MSIGSVLVFGEHRWRILDVRDGKMLLLTDEIIGQRDYHDRKEDVTWESSEIRNFLNTEFLDSFDASDGERILATTNRNGDNPWYPSRGGNDTVDKVFLLSLDEVVRSYFGDSGRLLDEPKKNQRYWFERKDGNNGRRRATFMGDAWWWWTRSPGKNNRVAVYVHGDGNIGIQGNGVSKTTFNTLHDATGSNQGGVRPALWVTIDA